MAFSRNRFAPASFLRLPALLILASGILLLIWRGTGLLTTPDEAHATPAEAALSAILDPVAGPGRFAVSVTDNRQGGRTVLILLDREAAPALDSIRRLLPLSVGLDLAGNDQLIIEQVEFATGLPGRPGMGGWLELALLGGICLLAIFMIFEGRRVATGAGLPPETASTIPHDETRRSALATDDPVVPEAVHLARRDPVMAAAIVRSWIQAGQERT